MALSAIRDFVAGGKSSGNQAVMKATAVRVKLCMRAPRTREIICKYVPPVLCTSAGWIKVTKLLKPVYRSCQ